MLGQDHRRRTADLRRRGAACSRALPKVSGDWFFSEVLKSLRPAPRFGRGLKPTGLSNRDLEGQIGDLLKDVLCGKTDAAQRTITALSDRGLGEASLCIDVLSPVAARLGVMWTRDEIDFHDAAAACGQLELLFNGLKKQTPERTGSTDPRRRLLLFRPAGERHTFGLLMLQHFFERAGWQVSGGIDLELGPACFERVSKAWFAVAGASVGCTDSAAQVARNIKDLRRYSKNPELLVIAGGPLLADGRVTALDLGADLMAENAELAVEAADNLMNWSSGLTFS